MTLKHTVRINVADDSGKKTTIMQTGIRTLPAKIVKLLFGEATQIFVLTPGRSIDSVEIHERAERGNAL